MRDETVKMPESEGSPQDGKFHKDGGVDTHLGKGIEYKSAIS